MMLPNPLLPGAYWREGMHGEISYRKPELPRSKYSEQWVSGRKTGSFVTWDTISLCIKKKNQNLQELRIGWWAELKHQQVGKHWERHFISVFALQADVTFTNSELGRECPSYTGCEYEMPDLGDRAYLDISTKRKCFPMYASYRTMVGMPLFHPYTL